MNEFEFGLVGILVMCICFVVTSAVVTAIHLSVRKARRELDVFEKNVEAYINRDTALKQQTYHSGDEK